MRVGLPAQGLPYSRRFCPLTGVEDCEEMNESFLNKIAIVDLSPADSGRLNLPLGFLRLQQAWPCSQNHLLLEYAAGDAVIAGQWFASIKQLQAVMQETAEGAPRNEEKLLILPTLGVMFQAKGADRRLPALASLVARPEAQLLSHRPEQRATVRLDLPDGLFYAKVVHPQHAQGVALKARAVQNQNNIGFSIAKLAKTNLKSGILIFSAVSGQSVYALLNSRQLLAAVQAAGAALRELHSIPDISRAEPHGASEETETIKCRLKHIKTFAPHLYLQLSAAASNVFRALADGESQRVLLHRDFYDKKIFVDEQGGISILGLDEPACGEAAFDIANALVHFELRHLQSLLSQTEAMAAAEAFLEGYKPNAQVRQRIPVYTDAARIRLACEYAFRPYQSHLATSLLSRMGQPIGQINDKYIQELGVQNFLENGIRVRASKSGR